ncbi:MAG TPA: 5-formyltetrahydrofolate cyclo-ligase [Methanocorpusculum sp.]|nr:5-formyltetrahydrofolate cyclo-ligase [Methanocorpusculum sp.]
MDKTALRTELKERRFAVSADERKRKSERICSFLEEETKGFSGILAYAAKEPEVETLPYIAKMIAAGKTVAVPIIEKETHTLRLSRLTSISDLEISTFNVPEPVSAEKPISPKDVECVILPMVGFDRKGNRLGYGAGYYDRFLAANPHVKKIGLAYACQEVSAVPAEEYDIRMDEIITEDRINYTF